MDFSEKLNVLFKVSHAKGKDLADAMYITPPQISKMRKGQRGLPKSRSDAYVIALFFAERCGGADKKAELAKVLKVEQIKELDNEKELAEVVLNWLSDDRDNSENTARQVTGFLRRYGTLFDGAESDSDSPYRELSSGNSSLFSYFGSEGKRIAVLNFLNYIIRRNQAYTVNILTDESIAWVSEDPDFAPQYQSELHRLSANGCKFRRIVGPLSDMNQAFDSIMRWLPYYMTGKAESYYYKRMRDNLNRVTMFVVPDVAVLFSFSIGKPSNGVTFFTTDVKTVNVMAAEFEKYYIMCEPIMRTYSAAESLPKLQECMLKYESAETECYQMSNSLSFITIPWEIARTLEAAHSEAKTAFLNGFAQRYKVFSENLKTYSFTDIICLADAESVVAGKVPIPAAGVVGSKPQYYSAAGYVMHLQSILYRLEHNSNYHVVLHRNTNKDNMIVYSKEDECTIIARDAYPFSVFEASERYVVTAFTEHLRRMVPPNANSEQGKRATVEKIRELISQIESKRPQR